MKEKENYTIITNHQKLICALNILQTIEEPNNNVISARMLVEDEIQDSWERIRQIEKADLDFRTAEQVQVLN